MSKRHALAFPSQTISPPQPGMTLRDAFVISLMPKLVQSSPGIKLDDTVNEWVSICRRAYQLADVMIAVRLEEGLTPLPVEDP